jgi:hypothetical protein
MERGVSMSDNVLSRLELMTKVYEKQLTISQAYEYQSLIYIAG